MGYRTVVVYGEGGEAYSCLTCRGWSTVDHVSSGGCGFVPMDVQSFLLRCQVWLVYGRGEWKRYFSTFFHFAAGRILVVVRPRGVYSVTADVVASAWCRIDLLFLFYCGSPLVRCSYFWYPCLVCSDSMFCFHFRQVRQVRHFLAVLYQKSISQSESESPFLLLVPVHITPTLTRSSCFSSLYFLSVGLSFLVSVHQVAAITLAEATSFTPSTMTPTLAGLLTRQYTPSGVIELLITVSVTFMYHRWTAVYVPMT